MPDWLKRFVLRVFRVPPEPEPPAGDPDSIRVFRAAPEYFRYRLIGWAAGQIGTLIGLLVGVGIGLAFLDRWIGGGSIGLIVAFFGVLAWLGFLAQLPLTYGALRLGYELRWYMLSDRALRIREGVVRVRERTMTFANIQQISVRQGPLQRFLGIADVEVRSAGGGSTDESADDMHRGFFRGVADAESIRDIIRQRVQAYRGGGAGGGEGDDDPASATSGRRPGSVAAQSDVVQAARDVLDEARAIKAVVKEEQV